MLLGNLEGRLVIVADGAAVDVERASAGRFGSDPQLVYGRWEEFVEWARQASPPLAGAPLDPSLLGPPVPRPRQVFAVALNYPEHAAEAESAAPEVPLVFTKFPTCLTGPVAEVGLPSEMVDWEVELVVAIGREARAVEPGEAWDHVAGVTVGQDISARDVQRLGPAPQYSLGKSFPGFGPTGPWLATLDELDAADAMLETRLNGEVVQRDSTASMIFPVPELLAYVSRICPLLPGDLLFTGTPSGVGARRQPPRFLQPGDELVSSVAGVGDIVQTFVAAPRPELSVNANAKGANR